MKREKAMVVFQDREIRRTWFNDEWWFSVIDIVETLTDSPRPRKYWNDLKTKLNEEGFEVSEKIGQSSSSWHLSDAQGGDKGFAAR